MNANEVLGAVRDALHHPEDRAYHTFHALACVQDCEGFDLALDYACGARWGEEDAAVFADRERLCEMLGLCRGVSALLGTGHGFNATRLGVSAVSVMRAHALILELRYIADTAGERLGQRWRQVERDMERLRRASWLQGEPATSVCQHPTREPYIEWSSLRYGLNVYRFWGGWVAEINALAGAAPALRLFGPDERGPTHSLAADYRSFRREWPTEQPERVALWLEQGDRVRALLDERLPFQGVAT